MKKVSINFKIHQPYRLKRYRFFSIGNDHLYADDHLNESIISSISKKCYSPLCETLLDIISEYGEKINFGISVSGVAARQIEQCCPETLYALRAIAQSGRADFISKTYSNSLVSMFDPQELQRQCQTYRDYIRELLHINSSAIFCNTALLYSNAIAPTITHIGYRAAMIEGRADILSWRNPNHIYNSITSPDLKILIKNDQLSHSICFNPNGGSPKSQAEGFVKQLSYQHGDVNIVYVDMEQLTNSGNIDAAKEYLMQLFKLLATSDEFELSTLSNIINSVESKDVIDAPQWISSSGIEKNLSTWNDNEMQQEANNKLFSLGDSLRACNDPDLYKAWEILQSSDHIEYMNPQINRFFSPYASIYEAFINYMNVLSDLMIQIEERSKEK